MPLLHLPIQSGSNQILNLMNRKHNREYYLSVISKLNSANKDIKISSDFIIGYPSETNKDFNDTVTLVKKIEFINCDIIKDDFFLGKQFDIIFLINVAEHVSNFNILI